MKVYYKIAAPDEVQAELTHLRTREQAAEGLAEMAENALFHTVNAPVYPDGPCMEKSVRDDLLKALAAFRATEGRRA